MSTALTFVTWVVAALLAAAGRRGDGDSVPLRPVAPVGAAHGLVAEDLDRDGRYESVSWLGQRVPLADPVRDCSFGLSSDGRTLVILAGGLRESLDLYLVDRAEGPLVRLPTHGGRCLPSTFNGGSGSLPALDGRDLVLFAFERDGRVHFRVVDLDGGVYASRELALFVSAFEAKRDRAKSRVSVRFLGGGQDLTFEHPCAPRLEVEPWVVTFDTTRVGDTATQRVLVRNRGKRLVEVDVLPASGGEFAIARAGRFGVAPGAAASLDLVFAPREAGPRIGELILRPLHASKELTLRARGIASDLETIAVAKPGADEIRPAPAAASTTGGGLDKHSAGDRAEARAGRGGRAPAPAAVMRPPASLELEGDHLLVRGPAGATFVLSARLGDPEGAEARPVLGGLRGRIGPEGSARLPLASLGPITRRFALVALVAEPSGGGARTAVLELAPELVGEPRR